MNAIDNEESCEIASGINGEMHAGDEGDVCGNVGEQLPSTNEGNPL
jgi:hypothetical protein